MLRPWRPSHNWSVCGSKLTLAGQFNQPCLPETRYYTLSAEKMARKTNTFMCSTWCMSIRLLWSAAVLRCLPFASEAWWQAPSLPAGLRARRVPLNGNRWFASRGALCDLAPRPLPTHLPNTKSSLKRHDWSLLCFLQFGCLRLLLKGEFMKIRSTTRAVCRVIAFELLPYYDIYPIHITRWVGEKNKECFSLTCRSLISAEW